MPLGGRKENASMRICPKCQAQNEDSSRSCKDCGLRFVGSSFQGKGKSDSGNRKMKPSLVFILIVVLVAIAGVSYWLTEKSSATKRLSSTGGPSLNVTSDSLGNHK